MIILIVKTYLPGLQTGVCLEEEWRPSSSSQTDVPFTYPKLCVEKSDTVCDMCGMCDSGHNAYSAPKKMTADCDLPEHLRDFFLQLGCQVQRMFYCLFYWPLLIVVWFVVWFVVLFVLWFVVLFYYFILLFYCYFIVCFIVRFIVCCIVCCNVCYIASFIVWLSSTACAIACKILFAMFLCWPSN